MRGLIFIIGLVLFVGNQPVFSNDTLDLRVDADASLAYELDCLSGFIRCTQATIRTSNPRTSSDDRTLLSLWRDLRQASTNAAAPIPVTTFALPTPASLAAFSSRQNPATVLANAVPSSEIHRQQLKQSLLAHFASSFDPLWRDSQQPHLERLRFDLDTLFNEAQLSASLDRSAALFGQRADTLPEIQLIAIDGNKNGSLATLDSQFAYVESPIGERAADRAPVIAHELVHHWLGIMSDDHQRLIVDAFTDQTSDCAITAYHLLEEVLAASIGNGYIERLLTDVAAFERYLALPGSFYADLEIDRMAKAMLPLVSHYIDQSIAIDTDFANAYTAIAEITLGEQCNALAGQLRSNAFLLTTSGLQPARKLVQRKLGSTTTFIDIVGDRSPAEWYLQRHSAMSGVVATTRGLLPELRVLLPEAVFTEIETLADSNQRLVYGWRRSVHSTVYVIVGDELANTAAAMTQFVALNFSRFEGAWLPPSLPAMTISSGF